MKIFNLLILILLSQVCFAQLKIRNLDKKAIPKTILYSGQIINAVRWTDNSGDNIVITTETGITASKGANEDGNSDAALYAYHYLLQADTGTLTWKVYDFIKDCNVDLKANFIKNTFAVTDLNKDGKAEVWLMYKTVCHGDVSPSSMKIIMYEADKKYAARGTNRVKVSEKEHIGGEYSFDEAFKNAPEVFRQYATGLWKKNIMETWD